MSKGKKPPERSKIERAKPLAYLRRAADDARVVSEDQKPSEMPPVDEKAAAAPVETAPAAAEAKTDAKADAAPTPEVVPAPTEAKVEAPEAKVEATVETAEVTIDAAPEPTPKAKVAKTVAEAPKATPAPPRASSDVEDPTFLPDPGDLPAGAPTDPAPAPGRVPSGDSRSLRLGGEFALVYRRGSAVISRVGTVGTRGAWRVVEYPTPAMASNAYAKECSRFVGEGFSDYRD